MKNYFLFALLTMSSMFSCKNQEEKKVEEPIKEKKVFFPVADYLAGEISYVDSMPLKMVKYVTINKKTDSALIKLSEFDSLAKEFLPGELKDSTFEQNFDESSFFDQTTNSLTFTYSTKNNKSQLQRVDVLASRNEGFDKVKSVYMEKSYSKADTIVTKKLYWKAKKNFEIVTILQLPSQAQSSDHIKVVWDNRE